MILSLCMIVKDCSGYLDRCLSSCHTLFDEINIVDTGSTDDTVDIAKKYKARIFDFKWVDDFSKARNYSFSVASCDWIMWLDSDDIVSTADLHKLLQLKSELKESKLNSYMLQYQYNSQIVGPVHRIVRNIPGNVWWEFPVHETLIFKNPLYETKDILITHTGSWKQDGLYFSILKKAYEGEYANSGRVQHYLAREYYYKGEYKRAITLYRKHLNNIPEYTRFGAYYYYADSCFHEDCDIKGMDLCMNAINKDPKYADFYYLIGEYYLRRMDLSKSKEWFTKATSIPYPTNTTEVFMVRSHYGFDPRSRIQLLERAT